MCGIAGIIDRNFENLHEKKIKDITSLISHRGPDSIKTIIKKNDNFAFGTTRLSIIDLNTRSNQPYTSANNGNIITYNGEIYNYKEIKNTLLLNGIKFQTDSDTEVLLEGYNFYGEKILDYLEGMYAFTIWDKAKKTFFCARDRLGIKPFLYYKDYQKFIFCSEIKPIISTYPELKKIKYSSIIDVVNYGVVHQPETIYENIYSLKPGHYIKIDQKLNMEIFKYWDVNDNLNKDIFFKNDNEYLECLENNIIQSIKKQTISDVNLGTFLSGGLDSGVISLTASKSVKQKIDNYNIYFTNKSSEYNESINARNTSLLAGGNFFSKEITDEDGAKMFEEYINIIDQPSNDGLNTFLVSKLAKEKTKVCLSGLGADEIFFGYGIHYDYIQSHNKKKTLTDKFLAKIFKIKPNNMSLNSYFKSLSPEEYFLYLRKIHNKKTKDIFNNNFYEYSTKKNYDLKFLEYDNKNINLKKRIFNFEIKNYLCNTLLRDSDITSMSNSIEVRPVFLDHKLVELAASTTHYSFREIEKSKLVLREMYKKITKNKFTEKKKGFEIPFYIWMRNKKFKEIFHDTTNYSKKIYSNQYVTNLEKNIGKYGHNKEAFNFLSLNMWLKQNNIKL